MNYPNELVKAVNAIADSINGVSGNTVETITATVNKPFGNISSEEYTDLVNEVDKHNAEVHMSIDATSLGMGVLEFNCIALPDLDFHDGAFLGITCEFTQNGNQWYLTNAGRIGWIGGYLAQALTYNSTDGSTIDITLLVANLPCVTTIYRHPMPEE